MARRSPPFKFMPSQRWRLRDGELQRDGYKFCLEFHRAAGKTVVRYFHDFTDYELKEVLGGFLVQGIEELAGGSLSHRFQAARHLNSFMKAKNYADLTPEVYREFIRWCEAQPTRTQGTWSEATIGRNALMIAKLYQFGVSSGYRKWTHHNLEIMLLATRKVRRGAARRQATQSIDKAISHQSFAALSRAVVGEFEECKSILGDFVSGRRESLFDLQTRSMKRIDPNPFVVFALQAGMRFGLRASEFNALKREDIQIDSVSGNHVLYVHAPDKDDGFIPVDNIFLESLELCEIWSKEASVVVSKGQAERLKQALFVYPCPSFLDAQDPPLREVTTYLLNSTHLPYFFQKWFNKRVSDNHGNTKPLLHAEGDQSRPFFIDYKKLRNAFAVQFAERERSRVLTARVLRHKSIATAERYYLHKTRHDHLKNIQAALKTEAQFLVMGLKNSIEVGVSQETMESASKLGAVTPHGFCGEAIEGRPCVRAADCIECPHLVVLASRRSRFLSDCEAYLRRVEDLVNVGDIRGAENARKRALLCNAHLERIDNRLKGVKQ